MSSTRITLYYSSLRTRWPTQVGDMAVPWALMKVVNWQSYSGILVWLERGDRRQPLTIQLRLDRSLLETKEGQSYPSGPLRTCGGIYREISVRLFGVSR